MRCTGCKFWSELVAHANGGGPVEALCLNLDGPHRGKYTHIACNKYEEGEPIDLAAMHAERA